MAVNDFLAVSQPPSVGDADLGLPELPPAPQAPMAAPQKPGVLQMIMQALPGVLGGAMGPGAGTGLLQGYVQGQQRNEAVQRQQQQDALRQFQIEQQAYQQQAQQHEIAKRQRDQLLQQNIQQLRQAAEKAPDKKAYDAIVEAYANGLRMMGFSERIDGNFLRKSVPYAAPSSEKQAWDVLQKWQALPNNKKLLTDHPEQAANAMIPFDRDGDGEPEMVRLQDLSVLAGAPLAMTADGQVFGNPGTPLAVKANADGILEQLIAKAKAEGKQITPELTIKLQQDAIKIADQAKPADPTLTAIRQLQLDTLRNAPKQQYPPAMQRRIDAKVKAFDMQPVVKRSQTMAEAVTFANSLDPNTTNPADDQALIYAFAKAQDPDSVVREGEYATVQKYAQQWAATFGFNVARIFSNTSFLTPLARANMKKTIQARFEALRGQYENLRQSYGAQINRITGSSDGADQLIDYGAAFPEAPGATAPPAANDAATSARQKLGSRQ